MRRHAARAHKYEQYIVSQVPIFLMTLHHDEHV